MAGFFKDLLGIGEPIVENEVKKPKKGSYKSPSGRISPFDFEDVESSVTVKGSVFDTAVGSGTYVQANGTTSGRFPLNCIFHGAKHKEAADYFMASCFESGIGVLTHPSYSRGVYVVPIGEVSRVNNFSTALNQTVVSLTFYETTGLKMGDAKGLPSIFDSFSEVSASDFAESVHVSDPMDKASFKNRVTRALKGFSDSMKKASGAVSRVNNAITDASEAAQRSIDILIGKPLALARQCQVTIGEPRRQNTNVMAKLDAYNSLAGDIFSRTTIEPSKYATETINQFHLDRLFAKSIVANSAMLLSSPSEFRNRKEFIDAADKLRLMNDGLREWQDNNFASITGDSVETDAISVGGGMFELSEMVSSTIGNLITLSFSARTAVYIELPSERTPLDLCFELYGTTKIKVFDEFMTTNEIAGDEYFLIPKGRKIVYYV